VVQQIGDFSVPRDEYMPPIGKSPRPSPNTRISTSPSQNTGMLLPRSAKIIAPRSSTVRVMDVALRRALFSGMPVVKVGRGNAEGISPRSHDGLFIGGSNLTANKARILLMASLMKLGSLPPAVDPEAPTDAEVDCVKRKVAEYQAIFDSH
jgi:L-asparaginase